MARQKQLKVQVLQKGGECREDKVKKYEQAVRIFAKELMSTRMCNTLSIRVEMRATKIPQGFNGLCEVHKEGCLSQKQFTILCQRDNTFNENLNTLAHEMVHVMQKATGRLQLRYWKSDRQLHVRWEGQELGPIGLIPYKERPWEVEAYQRAVTLVRARERVLYPGPKNGLFNL